jgi:ribose 5-phosphate isomerase B
MLFIAADHAGYPLKEDIKEFLLENDYEIEDLSDEKPDPLDDYPDFASLVARSVLETENSGGILVCGTGQGMCVAANKFPGIRAALIYDDFTARSAAEHLDANIVCLGGRTTDSETALKTVKMWLDTNFSGEKRHQKRIEKIGEIEKEISNS